MIANITMLPCSHCGSVTHERHSYGGLTLCYCVDDAGCQARLFEKERKRAGLEFLESQEIKTDERNADDTIETTIPARTG